MARRTKFTGLSSQHVPGRAIRIQRITGITKGKGIPTRGLWFPVAPRQYTVSGGSSWQDNQIIGYGTASHPTGQGFKTITFESFFPGLYYVRTCKGLRSAQDFMDPDDAIQILEDLRDDSEIFAFIIGGTPLVSEKCRITDFSWWERAGTPLDRNFTVTFTTWETQTVKLRGGVKLAPFPKTYRVREGETLQDIALRVYGDVRQWKTLASANGIKAVESMVNQVVKKTTLIIPAVVGKAVATAARNVSTGVNLDTGVTNVGELTTDLFG